MKTKLFVATACLLCGLFNIGGSYIAFYEDKNLLMGCEGILVGMLLIVAGGWEAYRSRTSFAGLEPAIRTPLKRARLK